MLQRTRAGWRYGGCSTAGEAAVGRVGSVTWCSALHAVPSAQVDSDSFVRGTQPGPSPLHRDRARGSKGRASYRKALVRAPLQR